LFFQWDLVCASTDVADHGRDMDFESFPSFFPVDRPIRESVSLICLVVKDVVVCVLIRVVGDDFGDVSVSHFCVDLVQVAVLKCGYHVLDAHFVWGTIWFVCHSCYRTFDFVPHSSHVVS